MCQFPKIVEPVKAYPKLLKGDKVLEICRKPYKPSFADIFTTISLDLTKGSNLLGEIKPEDFRVMKLS